MKLNHVLVRTTDLEAMIQFWTRCIGLQLGERPPFPFPGAWLCSGEEALVHIVEDPMVDHSNGVLSHVALDAMHYHELIEVLNQHNCSYSEMSVPLPGGHHQVFIKGPDGLCVEMMFPMSEVANAQNPDHPDQFPDDHAETRWI